MDKLISGLIKELEFFQAEDRKPGRPVIAVCDNGRVVIAEYIRKNTVLEEDFIDEDFRDIEFGLSEYNEEKDCYYVKENWFEFNQNHELNYVIEEKVLFWAYFSNLQDLLMIKKEEIEK